MCLYRVNCDVIMCVWLGLSLIAGFISLLFPGNMFLELQCLPVQIQTTTSAYDWIGCPEISTFDVTHVKPKQFEDGPGTDWHLPYIYDTTNPPSFLYEDPVRHLQCIRVRLCLYQTSAVGHIKNSTSSVWFHSRWPKDGSEVNLKCVPNPNPELGQITIEDMADRLSSLCYSKILFKGMKLNFRYLFSFICARRLLDASPFIWAIALFGFLIGLLFIFFWLQRVNRSSQSRRSKAK